MNTANRQTIIFISILLFSIIMLWLCYMKFIFFTEKIIMLVAYALTVGYLVFGPRASKEMFRYKRAGYFFVLTGAVILIALSSLDNFLSPVYDRKIINRKIYYITGSPSFNNDWSVELIEYNFGFTEPVETYYIHGLYRPRLSIESSATGLYVKEDRH